MAECLTDEAARMDSTSLQHHAHEWYAQFTRDLIHISVIPLMVCNTPSHPCCPEAKPSTRQPQPCSLSKSVKQKKKN